MELVLVQWLQPMIDHFWRNKDKILSQYQNREEYFEYPNYGDLPRKIVNELSSDMVDIIQDNLVACLNASKSKYYFTLKMVDVICNGAIRVKK